MLIMIEGKCECIWPFLQCYMQFGNHNLCMYKWNMPMYKLNAMLRIGMDDVVVFNNNAVYCIWCLVTCVEYYNTRESPCR